MYVFFKSTFIFFQKLIMIARYWYKIYDLFFIKMRIFEMKKLNFYS